MPIPIENEVVTPNAVYVPMIQLMTGVYNGRLQTSAQITFAAAKLDGETWTPSGHSQTIFLSDLENLEPDLASLAPQVGEIYGGIINLVAAINAIRKVL